MKFLLTSLLPTAVAAFAPSAGKPASHALKAAAFDSENLTREIDIQTTEQGPVGFFDPWGFTNDIDEDRWLRIRAGELKNGRVAMLAVVGYVVQEVVRLPGELYPGLPFDEIPNGVGALNAIPAEFWMATMFAIGAVDFTQSDKYGYLETLPIGMSPEKDTERRIFEIQNGRLAMLAIFELFRHDAQDLVQPGFDGFDHLIPGLPLLYDKVGAVADTAVDYVF